MQTLRINALALCLMILAAATVARGQCIETFKLARSDGQRGDSFSAAVAVSGNRATVGAPYATGSLPRSGLAQLYDTETGELLWTFTTDDPNTRGFGAALAMQGNLVIIGAVNDEGSGPVSIFDTDTGVELSRFYSSLGQQAGLFGCSVAVSGDLAVIGASDAERCFVFDISNPEEPVELATFAPAVRAYQFGASVAVSGTTVVVSHNAWFDKRAFVFDISDPEHPLERATLHLTSDRPESWRHGYGTPVGIDGDLAIVGTYNDEYADTRGSTASLFDTKTGQQVGTLRPPQEFEYDLFGVSVCLSGTVAAVGSVDFSGRQMPRVFLYDVSHPADPIPIGQLAPGEFDWWGNFAWTVAIADSSAIVGDPWDVGNEPESGAAYLYDLTRCDFCPADFNRDGELDTRDVLDFLNAWTAGDPEADFNYDGDLDTRDVLAFLNAWTAGC
ncbi:MAG: hypothetical protein HND58_07000 [Planctomycetota bacterium]|nr:MAG: hypothetical protein HND58_07000 [Planctomycetota bacterium]